MSDLTDLEFNVLMMLDPYDDGVEVDVERFKPEVLATLRDMVARGYCSETPRQATFSHLQLTSEGRETAERRIRSLVHGR